MNRTTVHDHATRFAGKTAIVTGAASGIGEATAKQFASEGGSVVVADVQEDAGKAVATVINDYGGKAIFVSTVLMRARSGARK